MDRETAQNMMANAIKALLECGHFEAAQAIMVRTIVCGEIENVSCMMFGRSLDVLGAITSRLEHVSLAEVSAASLAGEAITQAAKKRGMP